MFNLKVTGDWNNTERYLKNAQNIRVQNILQKYGSQGVTALANATPKDSALTASSWDFKINTNSRGYSGTSVNLE